MLLGQHLDDLQALDGHALIAHPAGHTSAFPDPARRRAGADRAGGAMAVALAMGLRPTTKAMAPDHALEAAALGCSRHVDQLAGLEEVDIQELSDLVLLDIVGRELAQIAHEPAGAR